MAAKDIFGLVVRLLGLGFVVFGILYLSVLAGASVAPGYSQADYVVAGVICVLAGLFCLRYGSSIVRFTYRDDRPKRNLEVKD